MRPFFFSVVLCLGWGTFTVLYGQNNPDFSLEFLEDMPDEFLEQLENHEDILENLQFLKEHPLDLHTATADDLQRLILLTPIEIKAIIDYRDRFGPFIDIHELQVIQELSIDKIFDILPFLHLSADKSGSGKTGGGNGYALFRTTGHYPLRQGYIATGDTPAAYRGSPVSLLFRFRKSRFGDYSYGIGMEKDAGEPFNFDRRVGFDSYHFHYYKTHRPGRIKTLALGDYRISLGQGLLQYHGFTVTKSVNPLLIKRVSPVIQPFSGTSEYFFFRGAALSVEITRNIRSYFFLHHKKRDATIRDFPDEGGQYFSALQTSGLHRTIPEEEKRNNLPETMIGNRMEWKKGLNRLGINTLYHYFALPYFPQERIDNVHRLTGKSFKNLSLDLSTYVKSVHLFGEVATQEFKEPAFTITGLYSFHPKIDGGILVRRFPAYFAPMYSGSFSARTLPNNESGIYIGLNYFATKKSQLSFYVDSWKGLWPTFQATGPAFDQDILFRYDIRERKKWEGFVQLKFKHRSENVKNDFPVYDRVEYRNQSILRMQFRKIKYQYWQWTTRIESNLLSPVEGNREGGIMIYSDFHIKPLSSPWSLAGRLAWFHTDSYASRIYSFEPDIRYSFSVPSYYGRGFRLAMKAGRKWRNGLFMEVRTGWTYLPEDASVGSGHNTVPGHIGQEAKLQIMYSF